MNEYNPLKSRYDTAASRIKQCKPNDKTAEHEYMIAYQNLVKAGLAQQIKRKYRV